MLVSCYGMQSFAAHNDGTSMILKGDDVAIEDVSFSYDDLDCVPSSSRHVSFGTARLRRPDLERPTGEMFLSTDESVEVPLPDKNLKRDRFRKSLPLADRNVLQDLVAQGTPSDQKKPRQSIASLHEDLDILEADLAVTRSSRERKVIERDLDKIDKELSKHDPIRQGWLLVEGWVLVNDFHK